MSSDLILRWRYQLNRFWAAMGSWDGSREYRDSVWWQIFSPWFCVQVFKWRVCFHVIAGFIAIKSGSTEREKKNIPLLLIWNHITIWCNAFTFFRQATKSSTDSKCLSKTELEPAGSSRFVMHIGDTSKKSIKDQETQRQQINTRQSDLERGKKPQNKDSFSY